MSVDAPARPPTGPTTTDLLRAAAGGDASAWRHLVERYEPTVRASVVGLRLQPADAGDAVQDTWLRMVEHHRDIREPEALAGWLRTTARREGLRIVRERDRVEPLDDPARFPAPDVDVEQGVVDADTARHVRALVDVLPPRSGTLIRELFVEVPPGYAELARRTGVPVGSIGPTRARALAQLRRLFDAGADGRRSGVRRGA